MAVDRLVGDRLAGRQVQGAFQGHEGRHVKIQEASQPPYGRCLHFCSGLQPPHVQILKADFNTRTNIVGVHILVRTVFDHLKKSKSNQIM